MHILEENSREERDPLVAEEGIRLSNYREKHWKYID